MLLALSGIAASKVKIIALMPIINVLSFGLVLHNAGNKVYRTIIDKKNPAKSAGFKILNVL